MDSLSRKNSTKRSSTASYLRWVFGFLSASIWPRYLCTATCSAGVFGVSPASSNPGTPSFRPPSSCRLRRCAWSACAAVTPADSRRRFPPGAPLDEIQTVRQGNPVVVAFGVPRNGRELPFAVDFDLLNDVDVGH